MMNDIFNAIMHRDGSGKSKKLHISETQSKNLYSMLKDKKYDSYPYQKEDLKEGMVLVSETICQYWKPRYLMDNATKHAYEFMDGMENLCTVTENDIDFDSMKSVSENGLRRAHALDAQFPTLIRSYENDIAEVSWQVNPDGMYYMDEDGYGMTDDVEETIYGFIDRKGQVVGKFRFINDNWNLLRQMREEAEGFVKMKSR